MKASSSMASAVPNPPGTHSTSQRSTAARSASLVKVSPSASTSMPPMEATTTLPPGSRLKT
jgi:hypothetical protein